MTLTAELAERPAAARAYDSLAPAYDLLTNDYRHDLWLERIESLALANGLSGRRLLDIACGTGKSFLPLLRRGYETTACDISERMVELARAKAPSAAITIADMRSLGRLGEFDLITCLDDAVNYLLDDGDLVGFCTGIADNLAASGIAVFDVNSLRMYREGFAQDWIVEDDSAFVAWSAREAATAQPGEEIEAIVHVFSPTAGGWQRRRSEHRQRHWPAERILDAAERAGLRILATYGQRRGAVLELGFDELVHTKALFLATHMEGR
jgi:SAM-dependent methyltransferase